MFFVALATDYDDTIASQGVVDDDTLAALGAVMQSGRRLVLVTGRELDDLLATFPAVDLFDLVVAENGALLYDPHTREEELLAPPPDAKLVDWLVQAGTQPLSIGRSIIATWQPNEDKVLAAIRELGLEAQIIFNKGAVMVLPAGINKASGLSAALERLGLSAHNVVGIGDAENDHAFLTGCGCSVAVGNALPSIKNVVDLVTEAERGAGAAELARLLVETDLAGVGERRRQMLQLGRTAEGDDVRLGRENGAVLVAGSSGGGKSTVLHGLIESLQSSGQQCCIVDPEGDFAELEGIIAVGSAKQEPQLDIVKTVLMQPASSISVNLLAIPINDRPAFSASLMSMLTTLKSEVGRPHWLFIDEAHHVMPAKWGSAASVLPANLHATVLVTVEVGALAAEGLAKVRTVIATGDAPSRAIDAFCAATGQAAVEHPAVEPEAGWVSMWRASRVTRVEVELPAEDRRRHLRKYAEGELGADRSFYFRGPQDKLNLRAQNLILFQQIADGIDDETWLHHLRAGDYSRWFEEAIKDKDLAAEARAAERDGALDAAESKRLIGEHIKQRYTAPAKSG